MEEALQSLSKFLSESIINGCLKIIGAILILIIGFKITNIIVKSMAKSPWYHKLDNTVQNFSKNFISILLKIIVIVSVAAVIGVPMTSVVAVLGSAGLALGLALQGGLSNIAGGFIIMMFKPFSIGDYVAAGDKSGTVIDIGMFYTTMITPDNKKVVIPNGSLANSDMINYSANSVRRVDFTFGVSYDSDIDLVKKVLLETAENHSLVHKEPAPVVYMSNHASSCVEFIMRVWTNTDDYWTVNFDIIEQVKREFDKNGIEIPYNQLDVHMR